jgi:ribosomal protein S18 acetylase RimI-like enzyme
MNPVTTRQAVFADLEALAVLLDAHRQFQGQPADVAAAREFLRQRFEHGESVLFIAEARGADGGSTPLGLAQLYPSFSTTALARVFILNDLFVHEAGRRRGVASALLAAVEHYAFRHGAVRITLNVARDNEAGQALYKACGWVADSHFHMFHRYPTGAG